MVNLHVPMLFLWFSCGSYTIAMFDDTRGTGTLAKLAVSPQISGASIKITRDALGGALELKP